MRVDKMQLRQTSDAAETVQRSNNLVSLTRSGHWDGCTTMRHAGIRSTGPMHNPIEPQ